MVMFSGLGTNHCTNSSCSSGGKTLATRGAKLVRMILGVNSANVVLKPLTTEKNSHVLLTGSAIHPVSDRAAREQTCMTTIEA